MTRREQMYPVIRRLREDEGLMWREIGERLGLAGTTVHAYYSDPTGEQERKRKARFERTGRKWPCTTLVINHFGSWNEGLRAAGFEPLSKQEHPLGHAGRALREQDAA